MKVLVVNNAEDHILDYIEPIVDILHQKDIEYDTLSYRELLKIELSTYNAVILSASPRGNTIVDNYLPYYQWIMEYENPILGIGAGHYIVGKLFGGELLKNQEKETGKHEVTISKWDPLLTGMGKSFLVKQNHQDSVTLPKGFEILATSGKCRNQIMKRKSKPHYTTQFHAEIMNKGIILNFLNIIRILSK